MAGEKRLNGLALLAAVMAVVTAACGGEPPKTEAPPAPKPPAPKTVEERVARYRECWDLFNRQAWDAFKGCYADGVQSEQMGSRPPVNGADAVLADAKTSYQAFPDQVGTLRFVFAKEDTVVGLAVINGTNTGPMTGPDGKSTPATNKTMGLYMGHVIHWDATGDKAVREESYMDTPTMLAQLGLSKAPARPVEPKPADAAPTVVIAAGSEAEGKNVALYEEQLESFNGHDLKKVMSYNAPDAVFHDLSMPKDYDAKGNSAELAGFFKAFSDLKLALGSIWGAGDYVVAQGTFEGTNDGAAPPLGIKQATKKSVKVPFLEVVKYQDGKVKDDWLAVDSMALATQLGLMEQPK